MHNCIWIQIMAPKVNNQRLSDPTTQWCVAGASVSGVARPVKRQLQPPTNCSSLSADKCSIEWIRCSVARHQMRSQLKPPPKLAL